MPQQRTFPRTARITRKSEYSRVFAQGEKIWGRAFLCYIVEDDGVTRLGLVVSRKVGCAVVRNRVKRLLREFFRLNYHRFRRGTLLVVVARAEAAKLDGQSTAVLLERQLNRYLSDV